MNLALYIASRYIKAKKSHNAVNIISLISVLGVAIGTFALIVVLSVFNGFESLVVSLYNSFDPQIKVTPIKGKFIDLNDTVFVWLKQNKEVELFVPTLEENALLKYKDKQIIATVKGVPKEFRKLAQIDSAIFSGEYHGATGNKAAATVGNGLAYMLSLQLEDIANPLTLYLPKREEGYSLNPEDAFISSIIQPSGVFSIQQEFDVKYVLADLNYIQDLMELNNKATSVELKLNKVNEEKFIEELKIKLGNNYLIRNRFQQHELLYKIMRSEKWAVFLILAFIIVIATFNVIGSLTMLIVEKKKDIDILQSLGANNNLIKRIFLIEGLLITLAGAFGGLILGFIVCYIQYTFGIIKLGGAGTFVIDAYPVKILWSDFIYVFLVVSVIGFIAAWIPARQILKENV